LLLSFHLSFFYRSLNARLDAGKELHVAVAELLAATDYPEIGRWIQFPRGLMLVL